MFTEVKSSMTLRTSSVFVLLKQSNYVVEVRLVYFLQVKFEVKVSSYFDPGLVFHHELNGNKVGRLIEYKVSRKILI